MSEVQTEMTAEEHIPTSAENNAVTEALPIELEEKRFEFQPVDDKGRPVGGKQVIKYRTAEELGEKMAEQNKLLILKLRSETRKNRLGITENEDIPTEAPRFEEPVTFRPRVLSPEERIRLSRDLLDPDKFDEASDVLFESKVGAKPSVISQTLSELQEERLVARAKAGCDAFIRKNPSYIACPENQEAITNWMIRHELAPVEENFQKAYDVLKASGILVENIADTSVEEVNPVQEVPKVQEMPPVAEPTVQPEAALPLPAQSVQEEPTVRIPTGLNKSNSEDVGNARPVGDDIVYEVVINGQKKRFVGLAAINAMPSDEFKRRVQADPNFNKKLEKLEQDAAERRQAQRR